MLLPTAMLPSNLLLLPGGMLFADAISDVFTLIVIVITFLGWIINLISAKNKVAPPPAGRPRPPAPPRPRNEKLQDEINIFIDDLAQRDKTRESKPASTTAKGNSGNAGAAGGRRKRPAEPQPQPVKPPPKRRVPGDEVVNRPSILRESLGSSVRDHVAGHIEPQRIAQEVAADVGDRVKQSVSEHLGKFSGGVAPAMRTTSMGAAVPKVNELIARLRNPSMIREAFVINAILARPVRKPRT